jgi:Tfp pilus assembly protein PilV
MFIKLAPKTRRAWTLVEMMVAVGIFSLCGIGLMGLYLFSVKSMASMYNYCLLDQCNRQAMDQLTREIRQATKVLNYTTNSVTILAANNDGSTSTVTYSFSPSTKKMLRTSDGASKALLNDCSLLSFQLFTRCPSNGVFGSFPVAVNNWSNTVKVLQLTWKTSMTLPGGIVNSENVQTARIVIRKQQDS